MKDRTPPKKMADKIIKLLKKEDVDDNYLRKVIEHVRNELDIHRQPSSSKKLPDLLTEEEMRNLYKAIWINADPVHMVMFKLLFYTGVRNSELVNIEIQDVDLMGLKIHIKSGKGDKDRFVPVPESFRGEMAQYLAGRKIDKRECEPYLFITNRGTKYSTRWVREIIRRYAENAGINKRIYPHLFRHQLLTFLTNEKLIDAKIQLISGHSDRQSLAIYQDLSLADVQDEYESAMRKFPVK